MAIGALMAITAASPVMAQQLLLQIPPVSPNITENTAPKERPSRTSPRYAAVLMDAHTGEILYANAFRELRHPASITKVMTLYLAFDALASGNLKLTDPVVFSKNAANQRPSKLGIAPGKSITVDEAIRVIAVKSAHDVAMALAETIARPVCSACAIPSMPIPRVCPIRTM
jgi:D-alanyl-D-alanine carboxypeptidase